MGGIPYGQIWERDDFGVSVTEHTRTQATLHFAVAAISYPLLSLVRVQTVTQTPC